MPCLLVAGCSASDALLCALNPPTCFGHPRAFGPQLMLTKHVGRSITCQCFKVTFASMAVCADQALM